MPILIWQSTGFYVILFLAGMEGITAALYEAARIDGAGLWTLFWRVTLPLLWDVVTTGVVFLLIGGLRMFDLIWVLTNQRPPTSSHVVATYLFQKAFKEYDVGYGTAVAVVLFLVMFLLSLTALRLLEREAVEHGA